MLESEIFTKVTDEAVKDWEITPDGLWIATRHFLIRRGYCCGNQCRNCPYINWRETDEWRPVEPARVQVAKSRVSPRSIAAARIHLRKHEELLHATNDEQEQAYHRAMVAHYRMLLEKWTN